MPHEFFTVDFSDLAGLMTMEDRHLLAEEAARNDAAGADLGIPADRPADLQQITDALRTIGARLDEMESNQEVLLETVRMLEVDPGSVEPSDEPGQTTPVRTTRTANA